MKRFSFLAILFFTGPALAGVYDPNEPCPFEVTGGVAKPLPHPKFKSLRNERLAELNPDPKNKESEEIDTPAGKQTRLLPRGKAMKQVRELSAKLPRLTPAEQLALSAALVRTGTLGKEFAALKRLTGERPRDYRLAANFVHAETETGNWGVAVRNFEDHVLELDPPRELPGTSADQLKWVLSLDKRDGRQLSYYQKWLRARRTEAARKSSPDDDPYPLFDVTFTGSELPKGKLPADAVAIVQQLALWSPADAGLLWLLAEVYAANGMLREADDAFNMCTWGSGLTGRKMLMDHRRLVMAEVEKLPPPTPEVLILTPVEAPKPPDDDGGVFALVSRGKLLLFGGIFLAFAVILLVLQVRLWRKRRSGG